MFKEIFNQSYPGQQRVLDELLKPLIGEYTAHNEDILKSNPAMQKLAEQANIKHIKRIADFELDDIPLNVFDITLSDNVRIKYSRVNIQKVVRSVMDFYSGAIMFFHTESNEGEWRISFVEKEDTQKSGTSAKRYTFLVGESQSVKTVNQRFEILKNTPKKSVEAIKEAFSVEKLTKEFYNDLFRWYSWTLSEAIGVTFPNDTRISEDDKEKLEEKIIRLITRVLFIWFIKHKNLIPEKLFKIDELKKILKDFDPNSTREGNYYNAILQNLFFATLNKPVGERGFASLKNSRDIKTLYRYAEMFSISEDQILELFRPIPFLNGGLFECLDKELKTDGVKYHLDGFSRNDRRLANGNYSHRAFIPNCIFFGNTENEGLISILERYNFTIEENSTSEMQVALDPELLGNVFENLLGAFNEETKESARKQSGSFYTPREIVNFMVDESLKAYLKNQTEEEKIFVEVLFKDENLSEEEAKILKNKSLCKKYCEKLKKVKILDPACGSGAFPMGILNRMVELLDRLDVENQKSHYDLKLHLIEKCIYGIDLQSIAVQISKLRFFISLVIEQKDIDLSKPEENYRVWTLPNLETKFVAANTLIGVKKNNLNLFDLGRVEDIKNKLLEIRHEHFYAKNINKKKVLREEDEKYREELLKVLEENGQAASENLKNFTQWNPYDQNATSPFFDMEWMFGIENGFDIIIGNPPYISTKGISTEFKKDLEVQFGFSDDTYSHFFFKGYYLLSNGGVLSFITPKTFWTTQTKRNLRDLILSQRINYIFDTANPFESAMVDTCITSFSKNQNKNKEMKFLDGSKDLKKPIEYYINQQIFIDTQNSVIFKPTEYNLKIHSLYGKKVKELYEKWWDKISTSKNIAKNEKELQAYRESLKPGDIALLGCLTEGGQGLATANNGKYIAVRKSTKWADNILKSRPKKLAEAVKKKKIKDDRLPQNGDYVTYLNGLSEVEIAELFDDLKEEYGRDIFGQGYIYKLVDDNEIADVETLTQDEKDNGIDTNKKYYVPYDKGDKDGNRWYLETPFAIAWSKENVGFLKTNSGKKGQGMPVVRNPQFYFKEGFCWTDVNSTYLKSRLKKNGVFDVLSMSLFTLHPDIPDWYYVCLINSRLISLYVDNFINNTSHFQINDARQLPIIITKNDELNRFEKLFKKAVSIKEKQFSNEISNNIAEKQLYDIQTEIDKLVNALYSV